MESLSHCDCTKPVHTCKLIAVTGGPGAGKTAVLGIARRRFCRHVVVLPESASIVYKGGFWRKSTPAGQKAVQRAIFKVQRQLEWLVQEEGYAVALCDRGTVDGLAYWPDKPGTFWSDLQSDPETERARYHGVIHLRTPVGGEGYNFDNPVRIESPEEAERLDRAVEAAWAGHANRHIVESTKDFLDKTKRVLTLIEAQLPDCCFPGEERGRI